MTFCGPTQMSSRTPFCGPYTTVFGKHPLFRTLPTVEAAAAPRSLSRTRTGGSPKSLLGREKAIDYMLKNTGMVESDVVAEVERYIVWPG